MGENAEEKRKKSNIIVERIDTFGETLGEAWLLSIYKINFSSPLLLESITIMLRLQLQFMHL